uniref:Transcription initiation factor IIA subunit 2 n=1 Tax=Steinernema glaseri TaxID=37863 RepID=A0A1I7ZTX0_9BILA
MTYQMYRTTTLGEALQRTLDDFVTDGQIPQTLSNEVLKVFDKKFAECLASKAKNKISFKADKLRAYRFCDNVWTFLMEEVDFRDSTRPFDGKIKRVKFVACDASTAKASS